MRSFFSVSHKMKVKVNRILMRLDVPVVHFSKNPKKRVSKMETQFVTIIFRFYFMVLLECIRIFVTRPSKKKSKKEQGLPKRTF
jgi:hypothetical protein